MSHRALGQQFSEPMRLYRGEGTHEHPSYYPKTGPDAQAGHWYTSDLKKAQNYAASSTDGRVYQLDAHPHEFKASGGRGNYVVADPAVRARRKPLT